MTVCPTYPYKLDRLQYHGIEFKNMIQFGAAFVSNDSSVSPKEFYEDVVLKVRVESNDDNIVLGFQLLCFSLQIDEIVSSIKIYAEGLIDGKNIFELNPNDEFCGATLFKTKQYYYNGDCFALIPPECLRDSGLLEITFKFFDKTDIFIHHKGQFLSPNSR